MARRKKKGMHDELGVTMKGHVKIVDDLGNVLLDKYNAIHPQNMARVIARALSNESNFNIWRIAFGNGGTTTDAAFTITYKTPNDGQPPDTRTWDSRLYHETYSEIIDEGQVVLNPLLGTDPGSADANTGTRPGGGAVPADDPPSTPHVSGPGVRSVELGLTSQIIVTCVLNPEEPTGQTETDTISATEASFAFDELGLYTPGAPAADSTGYQDVDVGNRFSTDDTGLVAGQQYSFKINVDAGGVIDISFTVPLAGGSGTSGEVLYGDLCQAINTGDVDWNPAWGSLNPLPGGATVAITDDTTSFSSITGAQTYGFLRFTSPTVGSSSSMAVTAGSIGSNLFTSLNPPTGGTIKTAVAGQDAGVQNAPTTPGIERERLLSHLIFNPVVKAANRTLTVTYTITVSLARSF
jgi:hypothetical protein